MKDGLTPVLERIAYTDALILGSPIYFGIVTGEMRSFMERLLFPNLTYTRPPQSLAPRNIPTAFVYTMNVSEQLMKESYGPHIAANAGILKMMFGQCESLYATIRSNSRTMIRWSSATSTRRSGGSGAGRSSRRTVSGPLSWGHSWQRPVNKPADKKTTEEIYGSN
jgi:multimeric flavodoxin WrbA